MFAIHLTREIRVATVSSKRASVTGAGHPVVRRDVRFLFEAHKSRDPGQDALNDGLTSAADDQETDARLV